MTDKVSVNTSMLFAVPSALDGLAGILDIGKTSTEYNLSETPQETDYEALHSDWGAVGEDMWRALDQYEREQSR